MKKFNTTGICVPWKHYMVDLSEIVRETKSLVDAGKYFSINRARQYGKTTTIGALCRRLEGEYVVVSLDFQDIEAGSFANGGEFSKAFARIILDAKEFDGLIIPDLTADRLREITGRQSSDVKLDDLFRVFRYWFQEENRDIVLIIDEVDSASNNQVFMDFLAQLRSLYLKREKNSGTKTFQSVILAGVSDIRYLKSRIRDDANAKINSPWNIAADFAVDMSFSEKGIKGMLEEYEADHQTGMNTAEIAKLLREYTNGYPFLVSRLCQLMDETVSQTKGFGKGWTREGFEEAVKLILIEDNTLFQSLSSKLNNYPELRASLRSLLMEGEKLTWNTDQKEIVQMNMYGFIRNEHNSVCIDNRIFETRLYNLFLSDEELKSNEFSREGDLERNLFVEDGKLNVRLILERFIKAYHQICGPLEESERLQEKGGRELFLLYLKPIINGTGNYYIEAQTRDQKRTDVIIDYLGKQYIIELKIWRGERYNAEGEKQISEYLEYFGLDTGYMLSFNFNKKKETGVRRVEIGSKILFEGTV